MYPSQQNSTDQTANFFWLLAIISIGLIVLWYCEKNIIVKVIFAIRHAEISFVQLLVLSIDYIARFFHMPVLDDSRLALWQKVISNPNIKAVTFDGGLNGGFFVFVYQPPFSALSSCIYDE